MSIKMTRSSDRISRVRPAPIFLSFSAVLMIGTGQYSPTVSILSSASSGAPMLPPTRRRAAGRGSLRSYQINGRRARPRRGAAKVQTEPSPGARCCGACRAQEVSRSFDGRLVHEYARPVRGRPEPKKILLEVRPQLERQVAPFGKDEVERADRVASRDDLAEGVSVAQRFAASRHTEPGAGGEDVADPVGGERCGQMRRDKRLACAGRPDC